MREHAVNSLDNFICGWYMDDTSLCDDIIQFHKDSPMKYDGAVSNFGKSTQVDTLHKKSTDVILNDNRDVYTRYMEFLKQCINKYIEKYQFANSYPFCDIQTTNIQYYKPSEAYYSWHSERMSDVMPSVSRHLVFMTYLNDVQDQGETEFYHQKLKIKPEKGLTLIWGSDWTFTHRGIASPSQEKYIVTGWLNYSSQLMEQIENQQNAVKDQLKQFGITV